MSCKEAVLQNCNEYQLGLKEILQGIGAGTHGAEDEASDYPIRAVFRQEPFALIMDYAGVSTVLAKAKATTTLSRNNDIAT